MIGLTDLADVFGLFSIGLGIGVGIITIFFVIGSTVAYIYSLMTSN